MGSITAAATLSTAVKLLPINPTSAISSLSSAVCFRPATKFRSLPSLPRVRRRSIQAPGLSTSTITATISVGDTLPESTFSYFDSAGELQTTTVSDLTKDKKAIFFGVPGAFTPTCSQKHLPGFIEKSGDLRARGVDTIACVSVNDAFVMKAWKDSLKVGDEVLLLSDGNGEFTRALGVELDLRDKPVGLGFRSRRYALLADDGIVKVLNLEEGGSFTVSSADDMLKALS